MDEISNKTLATLLVVAIVISLAGTFFAMRGVSQVTNYVTGAAEAEVGLAQVNISEITSISVTQPSVDFGVGTRNASKSVTVECNLSTNDGLDLYADCWEATGTYDPTDFKVENDGNVNVEVNITSNSTAAFFDTCDSSTVRLGGGEFYGYMLESVINDGDAATGCKDSSMSDFVEFNGVKQELCSNLTFTDTEDTMNISIKLGIPAGPAGVCDATVTFEAARNY